jgi:S-adenosyl methyltransferase
LLSTSCRATGLGQSGWHTEIFLIKGLSGFAGGAVTQGSAEGRDEDGQAPSGLDTTVAHQARIYDYWLGGKDNFAVDREAAEQAIAAYPPILRAVRAQRAFLARAVRFLAECGVRQFLDIGAGIPTANNTHEVAQAVAPDARIVYVDNDPIVLAHARALLTSATQGATAYLDADLRDCDTILAGAADLLEALTSSSFPSRWRSAAAWTRRSSLPPTARP